MGCRVRFAGEVSGFAGSRVLVLRARFPVLQVRGFRHDFLLQPQFTRAFYRKTLVRKRLIGRIYQ